ncbi:hypothetical protein AB1283_00835 [Bacillus sp. S13(2024)]|uniref:hypothetical protein n=1 Tax=Bacillus sp. S13(2024) TaxID=3162885 RepID=UPI003D25C953
MKQIYKAEDGKVFETKGECLKYEFELKGGSKHFEKQVEEAIVYLENTTNLTFKIIEAKAKVDWDGNPNTDELNYVEWQTVDIVVYANKEQRGENFSRGSQGGFNKDTIIEDILEEYVRPYESKFEGFLEENGDYYGSGFKLDGIDLDSILRAAYGNKIRIEIIE